MAGQKCLFCPLIVCLAFALSANGKDQEATKAYIVHMAKWHMPAPYASHEQWYTSLADSLSAEVVYHYTEVFHGFATTLRPEQAEALRGEHGVLGIYPEEVYQLDTTRTSEFLGLSSNYGLWPESGYGEGVVVGVLDTCIWPESESFNDDGLGPLPAKWKGLCKGGGDFLCKRKIVGARYYGRGRDSFGGKHSSNTARDTNSHGSRTSSTAAGALVRNASILGYATGTARGMATRARIAAYKVCWNYGCREYDILAAMDQAVIDGVDVLSVSIRERLRQFYKDPFAIRLLGAMEKGVFVSCAPGNEGPRSSSLSHLAPWIATIDASTVDRDFPAYAVLGNGQRYHGVSLYAGKKFPSGFLNLLYAGNVSLAGSDDAKLCGSGTLDPKRVAGSIVLCERGRPGFEAKGEVVRGIIVAGDELFAKAHLIPVTVVNDKDGNAIKAYIINGVNKSN